MRAPGLFRDSVVGQLIYSGSGRRWLLHPEDEPDFKIPPQFLTSPARSGSPSLSARSEPDSTTLDGRSMTLDGRRQSTMKPEGTENAQQQVAAEKDPALSRAEESAAGREYLHHTDPEKGELSAREAREAQAAADAAAQLNPYVVHWYGPDDPDCPQNVSILSFFFFLSRSHTQRLLEF